MNGIRKMNVNVCWMGCTDEGNGNRNWSGRFRNNAVPSSGEWHSGFVTGIVILSRLFQCIGWIRGWFSWHRVMMREL